jgi:hypothetical protein
MKGMKLQFLVLDYVISSIGFAFTHISSGEGIRLER